MYTSQKHNTSNMAVKESSCQEIIALFSNISI